MAPESRQCPQCGAEIPERFPQKLCPKCLLGESLGIVKTTPLPRRGTGVHSGDDDLETGTTIRTRGTDRAPRVVALQPLFPDIEIIDLLGAGGMGAVYKARQPRLDRLVALKVLSCPPEMRAEFVLRFEREAQVMAKLSHPNIITVHDFGEIGSDITEDESLFYFVMEFVDGPDLSQLIRADSLTPERSLSLVPQICDALQYAHDQGVTHRDIKPANILIDPEGVVKIADFGLATLLEEKNERFTTGLTMTGTSMGTPIYMAPEILEASDKVDHRADIYSLGVVFYEMLTGERPAGVFDPPSKVALTDPKIDPIVLKALNKKPERRFQSAQEIKRELIRTDHPSRMLFTWQGGVFAVCLLLIGLFIAGAQWGDRPSFLISGGKAGNPPLPNRLIADSSVAVLKPIPIETTPGRLRGIRLWKSPDTSEQAEPFDLSAAAPYSDFVQVVAKPNSGFYFALRANGEVISNLPNIQIRSDIRRLGQYSGEKANFVLIDREGAPSFLFSPNFDAQEIDHPIIDAATSDGNGLFLFDDGRAIPFGANYTDEDFVKQNRWIKSMWELPDDSLLTNVTAIAVNETHAAVLKADGSILSWGESGELKLPSEIITNNRTIALSTWNSVLAIDTKNRLRASQRDGELNPTINFEGVSRITGGYYGIPPFYQTLDGAWHVINSKFEKNYPEVIEALSHLKGLPPEAFCPCKREGASGEFYLLWIEPQ